MVRAKSQGFYEKNEVLERSIYCALPAATSCVVRRGGRRRKRRVLSQRMAFTKERVGWLAIIKVSIAGVGRICKSFSATDFTD